MIHIYIQDIPHDKQRYETVGDWWWEDDTLQIRVSSMSDWRREFLVAYHELFEAMWCKQNEVSQKAVDRFDKRYEANRKKGDVSEPGDDPRAPYYKGHQIATAIETLACVSLDESWVSYADEVESL